MKQYTDKQIWMDPILVSNLNSVVYDSKHDFDFVILVSGDGEVRVGKSIMAQQVAYYLAYELGRPFTVDNIYFDGTKMREAAANSPPSIFLLDESRADLDSKKVMSKITQDMMDFFAECGTLNHIVILVIPDFFEFPKTIATSRSEFLINVFKTYERAKYKGEEVVTRKRGKFFFYGKPKKKLLYLKGKKEFHNYDSVKSDFWGEFNNQWVIDKEKYEAKKLEFIKRDRGATSNIKGDELKHQIIDNLIEMEVPCTHCKKPNVLTNIRKAELLGVSEVYFYKLLKDYNERNSKRKNSGVIDEIPRDLT